MLCSNYDFFFLLQIVTNFEFNACNTFLKKCLDRVVSSTVLRHLSFLRTLHKHLGTEDTNC